MWTVSKTLTERGTLGPGRALAAVAAFALCLAVPEAPRAEEISLSIPEARELARRAFRAGDDALANALGRKLRLADPEDPTALILIAATSPSLGDAKAGREAGAEAWRMAGSDGLKHEAAWYTSRAAAADDSWIAAQFWMRRAYGTAPDDSTRDRVGEAFGRMRAVSPLTVRLSFSNGRTDNINGGSSSEWLVLDDSLPVGRLSGTARALSGTRTSATLAAARTLSRGTDHRTALTFDGYRTWNELSEEAREQAPGIEGSAFDYGAAEIGLTHSIAPGDLPVPDTYALAFGKSWYGYEPLDRSARLSLGRSVELPGEVDLRLGAGLERRLSLTGGEARTGRTASVALSREIVGVHTRFSLSARDVASDDANLDWSGASAALDLSMGEPLAGMHLSGGLSWERRDFDAYRVGFIDVPGGRQDETLSARLSLRIDAVGRMGFSPVIGLEARTTDSTISRFDGEATNLTLGVASAF
ncbi:hypothetical protein [Tropicimonas sp. IMCC34011]|uniref:hypothetical protein n=1 Tax=Tropicimonas sp. IMCC34011 TaxID=2248759 RepID=UPI001300B67C|nr:hypothetical protein [Tropicimonas sp. IMCC34011]